MQNYVVKSISIKTYFKNLPTKILMKVLFWQSWGFRVSHGYLTIFNYFQLFNKRIFANYLYKKLEKKGTNEINKIKKKSVFDFLIATIAKT